MADDNESAPYHIVVRVGKRQYRKFRHPFHRPSSSTQESSVMQYAEPPEEDVEEERFQDDEDGGEEELLEQEKTKREGDEFVGKALVAPRAVGAIIGRKGSTLRGLEQQTNTKISIQSDKNESVPQKKNEPNYVSHPRDIKDAVVTIRGSSAQGVSSARTRVFLKEQGAIDKLPYSHFVSVPLALGNVSDASNAMQKFQQEVLSIQESAEDSFGIESSLFTQPAQLHCTLLMLKIYSNKALQLAVRALRNTNGTLKDIARELRETFGEQYRETNIAGLEYMNDDPQNVHVLYGQLHGHGAQLLDRYWRSLIREYLNNSLTSEEELRRQRMILPDGSFSPKLHVTLLNTRRRGEEGADRQPFDARPLLQHWGSHVDSKKLFTRHLVYSVVNGALVSKGIVRRE
eukprot:gb/GECG01015596.1/.p1 GENE.gb/GECG01015596.1/~~gb/GECG01015596.1/.p1  ORF type:complete len:402 (+),score=60.18 gb/GECG01015596.1/:1-1206(+)